MSANGGFHFTAESVSEAPPGKVAEGISDALLDANPNRDSKARVAIGTLCKDDLVVIDGSASSKSPLSESEIEQVARQTIRAIATRT